MVKYTNLVLNLKVCGLSFHSVSFQVDEKANDNLQEAAADCLCNAIYATEVKIYLFLHRKSMF